MHKGFIVMAMVAAVWAGACATRSQGLEASEPEAATQATLGCKNSLDLKVDPKSGGKTFNRSPPWSLCNGGTLTVTNRLPDPVCLDILNARDGGTYTTASLAADGGTWDSSGPPKGEYNLGVCLLKDGGTCTNGCSKLTDTGGSEITETIKGNLNVVTLE